MVSRPHFDLDEVTALARELWGLEGELSELGSYDDRNFRVDPPVSGEGEAGDEGETETRILKIAAEDSQPLGVLQLQEAALRRLASGPSADLVPRLIPSRGGPVMVPVDDARGQRCFVRVLSWLSGPLWASLEAPPSLELLHDLGRAVGQLDRDLEGLEHPAMDRRFPWNLVEAEWIAGQLEQIQAGPGREQVMDALAQFRAHVSPRLAEGALPRQVIHGDVNDHNVVVDETGRAVRGIFDFGDIVAAPRICELAITLAYALMGHGVASVAEASAQLCAGYCSRCPLTVAELELLFDLVRARLAVSVVSSTLARAREPDNRHVSASETRAFALLDALTRVGRQDFLGPIAQACELSLAPKVPGARDLARDRDSLIRRRRERLGPSLSLSYADPLYIRRGEGCWLFDERERAYLDCVNNVAHVGHGHPRVVEAGARQLARLNTNTRTLHEGILDYADRLAASFPPPLSVVFMVCSGSEANELALRIARAHTGRRDVAVIDGAYHGNTTTLVELSPYKFDGPGGRGRPDWVKVIPTPDPYRGAHGDDGPRYAAALEESAAAARERGPGLAAFLCESILGCAGQVVPARGFLPAAYARARAAGAVVIADEVQVGFGRVGDAMWAFEQSGVVPDIVTLGKPIANGHPVGAVITTPELAASFATGMEYFNTFGGNPVSCAIASAVLDVIEGEQLMVRACEIGGALLATLRELDDPGIGQVRGRGLFLGVELVTDRETKIPDRRRARAIVEHARARGVLLSVDGPALNVIKIKPPLCFGEVEAKILLATLSAALASHPPTHDRT